MLKTILAIVAAVSVMSMAVAAEKSAAKADKAVKICEKTGKACTGGKNAAHNCKKGATEVTPLCMGLNYLAIAVMWVLTPLYQ